jgi:hypothetical protein
VKLQYLFYDKSYSTQVNTFGLFPDYILFICIISLDSGRSFFIITFLYSDRKISTSWGKSQEIQKKGRFLLLPAGFTITKKIIAPLKIFLTNFTHCISKMAVVNLHVFILAKSLVLRMFKICEGFLRQ